MLPQKIMIWLFSAVLCSCCKASTTPVFLQAISSALATIPFTGFPMSVTTGLAGAKLAVGAKLLYYLGFFGQGGRSKQFDALSASMAQPSRLVNKPPRSSSFSFPPSYVGFQGLGQPIFPSRAQFASPDGLTSDPSRFIQALAAQGINPLQLIQALTAGGIDPVQLLQAVQMNEPVFGSNLAGPGNRAGMQDSPAFPPQMSSPPNEVPQDLIDSLNSPDDSTEPQNEDIESFFSFLRDMDDNKCISRLICDIGEDPAFLGEFTLNIDGIISSLEVPPDSGANEYINIMNAGRTEGGCAARFTECTDDEYELVKSVAPTVGVPGMTAATDGI